MTPDASPDDDLARAVQARLHDHADLMTLEGVGPDSVMARARRRRMRRQGIAGALAVSALIGAGVLVATTNRSVPVTAGNDPAATAPATLPDAAPLRLAWQQKPDGLMGARFGAAETAAGTMYALSTAPGASHKDHVDGNFPATVYRLGDDGTWVPTAPPEATPRFSSITAGDDLLYGVSTAPGANGTTVPQLSSSTDGGATWKSSPVPMPAPPSRTVPWKLMYLADVAHVPGATAASVSFQFELPHEWYNTRVPPGSAIADKQARPEGLVLYGFPPGDEFSEEPGTPGSTPGTIPPMDRRQAMEHVLATVPWSELGVTGPEALRANTRILLADGERWTEIDDGPRLDLTHAALTAIGDELVLTSQNGMMGREPSRIVASSDGRQWREVHNPGVSALTGVGPAWVGFAPLAGENQLYVSEDRGANWRTLALNDIDPRLAGTRVQRIDGGPLGLFLSAFGQEHTDGFLVTTRDLHAWTVIPAAEVLGEPGLVISQTDVGRDRVVVTGFRPSTRQPAPLETVTAVGTPTRS